MKLTKNDLTFYVEEYLIQNEPENIIVKVVFSTGHFISHTTKMKVLDITNNDLIGDITKVESSINQDKRKYTVTLQKRVLPSLDTIFKNLDPDILLNSKIIQI